MTILPSKFFAPFGLAMLIIYNITAAYAEIPPPTGAECAEVTASDFEIVRNIIEDTLLEATSDPASSTNYGVSYYIDARNRADHIIGFLRRPGQDSTVTTYAEAGGISQPLMEMIHGLSYGGHWTAISAIRHQSLSARAAFDLGSEALDRASLLKAQAGRCYINAYFP